MDLQPLQHLRQLLLLHHLPNLSLENGHLLNQPLVLLDFLKSSVDLLEIMIILASVQQLHSFLLLVLLPVLL